MPSGADHQRIGADRVALHRLLWDQVHVALLAESDRQRHIHARQQFVLRIGYQRAQIHRAGGRVHGHIGEIQRAGLIVTAAVGQGDLHRGVALLRKRDVLRLAQSQQVGSADGEIHIERVDLLRPSSAVCRLSRVSLVALPTKAPCVTCCWLAMPLIGEVTRV